MAKIKQPGDLESLQATLEKERESYRSKIIICGGTGCQASRSLAVINAIKKEIVRQGLKNDVLVRATGCHGFCEQGPIMVIEPGNLFYCHVVPEDAREIVSKTIQKGEAIPRLFSILA